mgnify:CR=1 FL=1
MSKKKKRDFWDDIEDEELETSSDRGMNDGRYANDIDYEDDGKFHATRCLPLKVIMRILLFVAAAVAALSGLICYRYMEERADGSSNYFGSRSFSEAYNEAVEHVLDTISLIEQDSSLADSQDTLNTLLESTMGQVRNFSFIVQNEDQQNLFTSGDDAKTRIEASQHFMKLTTDGFQVQIGDVPTVSLNQVGWKEAVDSLNNQYIIYTAVDNNLTQEDTFYSSYMDYQRLSEAFSIARFAGIGALVVFILILIYCIMATGSVKGYSGVRLTWFDKIFTEIAAIISIAVLGGIAYGTWYVHRNQILGDNARYIVIAGIVLFYIILIRSYFSLVRRIKSGAFVDNALLYMIGSWINRGLNHLPKALKWIIIFLFLVALNGGLVLGLMYLRDFTVRDIPIIFIVAPIIFIIELIVFISCLFGGSAETEDIPQQEAPEQLQSAPDAAAQDDAAQINPEDWEDIDFGKAVKGMGEDIIAPKDVPTGNTQENIMSTASEKTVMLSAEETQQIRDRIDGVAAQPSGRVNRISPDVSEAVSEHTTVLPNLDDVLSGKESAVQTAAAQKPDLEETLLDFIQLNKDVRKRFRLKLKERSIGVTLRAPEKPIYLDIDKNNAIKVLSILFDNVEKYAKEGTRVYIEMYTHQGKMIYMMKNTIRDELAGQVSGRMGGGLTEAKKIIRAEGGKFITSVEGDTFKAGILLDAAE